MSAVSHNITWQFIEWYFYDQPRKILKTWKGFLLFNLEYFSVFLLIKTFFRPWRQYAWSYPRGLDIPKYLEIWFSNQITRVIGMILRALIILAGVFFEILILIIGFWIFIGWILLPAILFFLFKKYV